jgi:hypothetical protein
MSATRAGFVVTSPGRLAAPSVLLADNIDPSTHDFVSLTQTIHHIDAQVIVALKVVRASGPSVLADGNRLREIRKMDEAAQSEAEGLIKEALYRLISRDDIRYKGVEFTQWDSGSQTGEVTVKWINLRARDQQLRAHTLKIAGAR